MTGLERELADALTKLLQAYESLMPGLAFIAVDDYALINEAPIEARRVLLKAGDMNTDRLMWKKPE